MNTDQSFREFTHADGQVEENLALASKAMEAGKFEKVTGYALIARAWQEQRAEIVRQAKYGRGWLG